MQRIAFETSLLRSLPLDKALEEISRCGYENIEIGLAHFKLTDCTEDDVRSLKQTLSRYNLGVGAFCGIYPLSYPEEEVRLVGVEQFGKAIDIVDNFDCKLIVSELNGDMDHRQESQRAFERSIGELIPKLEKSDATLCFEAHPGDFLESNTLAVDLIKSIGSKHLKYLYCAPHSFILGRDVTEMIEYSKDVLGYVHFADSFRPERTFFAGNYFPKVSPHQHLIPGRGDVDLRKLILALNKINYQGNIAIDPFSHFDKPLDAARQSKMWVDSFSD